MEYAIAFILFLILPYLAMASFIIGIIYRISSWLRIRGMTDLKSVSLIPNSFSIRDVVLDLVKRITTFHTLKKMEKDTPLTVGTMMFHYGIWISLIGHLAMFLPLPISQQTHDIIALYVGGVAGLFASVGLIILIVRRVFTVRMRKISSLDDYFLSSLLILIILLGLTQTLYIRPDFMATVSPWLVSIFQFHPEVTSMVSVGPVTILHVTLGMIFIAYIPFSKMIHIISYVFQPTITKRSFQVTAMTDGGNDNAR